MGTELTTTEIKIDRFFGINDKYAETDIDIREARSLQNVNINTGSLIQRNGSTKLNSTAFKEKTSTNPKAITGLYQTKLNGTVYEVGIGGDAIREDSTAWNDITGAVTITDNANTPWFFSTFYDSGAANPIIIASNGSDAPIKWTGTGNAAALGSPPGNFKLQLVDANKLWVTVGDIVYFSSLRDGETWDTTNDIIRYDYQGEDITGFVLYGGRKVVFQENRISVLTGTDNRDLFSQVIITGDGTKSPRSIKEIQSRRYGNILAFLNKDGRLKGFNGTKNLIDLGDPAEALLNSMNKGRLAQASAAVYDKLGQYWCAYSTSNATTNDVIIVYDYVNDRFSAEDGRPVSTVLKHVGINACSIELFNQSSIDILVTGDYSGFALRQDNGTNDEGSIAISSLWRTGKNDFGNAKAVKLLSDLHIATTQTSDTQLTTVVSSRTRYGSSAITISGTGNLWGTMLWGTGVWSGPVVKYNRPKLTVIPSTNEGGIYGRYLQLELSHSAASEGMQVDEVSIGVSNLGDQPEYSE